jgi:hypothetical protein
MKIALPLEPFQRTIQIPFKSIDSIFNIFILGRIQYVLCTYRIKQCKIVSCITLKAKAILEQWCGYFELGQKKMLLYIGFSNFENIEMILIMAFFKGLIENTKLEKCN